MQIIEHFTDLTPVNIVINFIDVLLVWYVVYKVLTLIKGTKAVQLLKEYSSLLLHELQQTFRVTNTWLDATTSY